MARSFAFALLFVAVLAPFATADFSLDKDGKDDIKQNGAAISENVNIGGKDVKQLSTAIVKNDADLGLPKFDAFNKFGKSDINQNGLAISKNFNLGGEDVDQKSLALVSNDVDLGVKQGDNKPFGGKFGRKML